MTASARRPTQGQLVFPLLEVLADRGGRVTALDAADALAQRFALPDDEVARSVRTGDGQIVNLWRRHVRYARQKAVAMGYVANDGRGEAWRLTEAAYEGLAHAAPAMVVEVVVDDAGAPVAARVNLCVGVPTTHLLATGDARHLDWIDSGSVPLIATSIPYFDIKDYGNDRGQLATLPCYDAFLAALDDVWRECLRVLAPGGRLAVNVGDVLRSRAKHGSHHVLPLHADILARSTRLGFSALNGIIWKKIGNVSYEEGGSGILGTPGQPNGVITLGHEHVLLLRKPGPYRKPTAAQQRDSAIAKDDYSRWFRPVWDDVPGARADRGHPAPFPVEIPYRLARMFSFAGDVILDPFGGSGTTAVAAAKAGRDSIVVDVAASYVRSAIERLRGAPGRELAVLPRGA